MFFYGKRRLHSVVSGAAYFLQQIGLLLVGNSSSRRASPAKPSATAADEPRNYDDADTVHVACGEF